MASSDSFQNFATDAGGAVTALFGAAGSTAAADSYDEAERIARQNAVIASQATRVKDIQIQRSIFKTLGQQQADVSGAGFAASGTALDLLRSSASEGAMTKAINEEQGAITVNAYEEQATQFAGMAASARASAKGQGLGGLLQAGGAAYNVYGGISSLFGSAASTLGSEGMIDAGITAVAVA
jgi:hypothetical protein